MNSICFKELRQFFCDLRHLLASEDTLQFILRCTLERFCIRFIFYSPVANKTAIFLLIKKRLNSSENSNCEKVRLFKHYETITIAEEKRLCIQITPCTAPFSIFLVVMTSLLPQP